MKVLITTQNNIGCSSNVNHIPIETLELSAGFRSGRSFPFTTASDITNKWRPLTC
jgi:hypothetical protein